MYSGSTLTNISGNILGFHQKMDRSSRISLCKLDPKHSSSFPSKKLILHFEGKNGPDGIKSKSTGKHEPWHFYDPFDPSDGTLIDLIDEHYTNLVSELNSGNQERSAFEASWLAHAIIDGLTPAHHYPFEEELEKLRGESKETRDSVLKKIFIPGETYREIAKNNWKMWGSKGLFTTHALFEWGAAMIAVTLPSNIAMPSQYDIKKAQQIGISEFFKRTARDIALMHMYENFYKKGWTPKLANQVRKELAPKMAKTVTLAWYLALQESSNSSTS